MKRAMLVAVALLLFAIAFAALFPHAAVPLLARASHMYTVGLSIDPKAQFVFLGVGLAAAALGAWSFVRAIRS